ncbi:MAG: SpaA isopeptide-forming pilin-related protein, partial [Oscillospiraceae bacterium]
VNVRPNPQELIVEKLAQELETQTKIFADIQQKGILSQEDIKAEILKQFAEIKSVDIDKKHSAESTSIPEKVSFGAGGYTYGLSVNSFASGLKATTAGTAADGDGEDGQYLFTVELKLTKGANSIVKTLNIAPSAPIVEKATSDQLKKDAGIYITAEKYIGVTDIAVVDIISQLLKNSTPPKRSLVYEERNEPSIRLSLVQKWVDDVIAKADAKVSITNAGETLVYTVKDGMAQLQSGEGAKVSLKGISTAMLKGANINPFTTTDRKASVENTGDKSEEYTINILKQTVSGKRRGAVDLSGATGNLSNQNIDISHTFTHKEMVGITVIGGAVMKRLGGKEVYAQGAQIVLTSSNGKQYKTTVGADGNFIIRNVEPAAGGAGFSLYIDGGLDQTKSFGKLTLVPHQPDDTLAELVDTTTGVGVLPVTIISPNVGDIKGTVKPPKAGVVINLEYSDNLIASTTTDADGKFTFVGLPYGIYRVNAIDGQKMVTQIFNLKAAVIDAPIEFITMGSGIIRTMVSQMPGAPHTAANFPLKIFETPSTTVETGITAAEMADVLDNGGTIQLQLISQLKSKEEAAA